MCKIKKSLAIRILSILISLNFSCLNVAYSIPDTFVLRPLLTCSIATGQEELGLLRDNQRRLVLSFIRHTFIDIIAIFEACITVLSELSEEYHESEFEQLCKDVKIQLGDYYEKIKDLDQIPDDVEPYIKILSLQDVKIIITSIGRLVSKTENLICNNMFGEKKDEANNFIDIIKEKRENLQNFIKLLPSLRSAGTLDINKLITLCCKNLLLEPYKKHLSIEFVDENLTSDEFIEDESVIIIGIIYNFIQNANKSGGDDVEVIIKTAKEDDEWIRIEVSDTGYGIPEEILPHIFEKGFTTKESGKGGLGLYLTLLYLRLKRGKIEVDTMEGDKAHRLVFDDKLEEPKILPSDRIKRGTTFTITLPALNKQRVEKIVVSQRRNIEAGI